MASPKLLLFPCCTGRTHVFRAYNLATALESEGFDIHLALPRHSQHYFREKSWQLHDIPELDGSLIKQKNRDWDLAWHTPESLSAFIQAEQLLMRQVKPLAVINLFRLTVRLSATAMGIPVFALNNADFTPHFSHRLSRQLLMEIFQKKGLPYAEKVQNTLSESLIEKNIVAFLQKESQLLLEPYAPYLKKAGLLLNNYFELFDGQHTYLLDLPGIMPLDPVPAHYTYTGPIFFSSLEDSTELLDMTGHNVLICADCQVGVDHFQHALQRLDHTEAKLYATGFYPAAQNSLQHHCRKKIAFLPLLKLSRLPQFNLLISTGSRDLFYHALKAGIPHWICPALMDQKMFSERVCKMGLAYPGNNLALSGQELWQPDPVMRERIEAFQHQLPDIPSETRIARQIGEVLR